MDLGLNRYELSVVKPICFRWYILEKVTFIEFNRIKY